MQCVCLYSVCMLYTYMLDTLYQRNAMPMFKNLTLFTYGLIILCCEMFVQIYFFQLRRSHPSYHQVTLERSDFRIDFRTRLKNKPVSLNGSAKLILPCQGKQAWYIQLSSVIWTVYQTIVRLVKVINVCAVRCKINLCQRRGTRYMLHPSSFIILSLNMSAYVSSHISY